MSNILPAPLRFIVCASHTAATSACLLTPNTPSVEIDPDWQPI